MNSITKTCTIEYCDNKHFGKGWCQMHYLRWWRHGNTIRLTDSHSMSKKPEHNAWLEMRARCYNPSKKRYSDWGGRGIRVCHEWRVSFNAFYKDMGARPSPNHSLDRINNDGNYEPSNCRWATAKEQSNNRRNNVIQSNHKKDTLQ